MNEDIERLLEQRGWSKDYFTIDRTPTQHLIEAAVDPENWEIYITLDPQVEQKLPQVFAAYLRNNPGSRFQNKANDKHLEDLVYACVDHEIGHWNHCPFDMDQYADILSGIVQGLKNKGMNDAGIEQHKLRLGNLFMDVIDNVVNCIDGLDSRKYTEGISTFYLKEGVISKGFSEAYGMFVDIQMMMAGDDWEIKTLAQEFTDNYQQLEANAKRLTDIFLDGKLSSQHVYSNVLSATDRNIVSQELLRSVESDVQGNITRHVWNEKATKFAEVMHQYIPQMNENAQSPQSQQYQQNPGQVERRAQQRTGQTTGGQGQPGQGSSQGQGSGQPQPGQGSGSGSGQQSRQGQPQAGPGQGSGQQSQQGQPQSGQGAGAGNRPNQRRPGQQPGSGSGQQGQGSGGQRQGNQPGQQNNQRGAGGAGSSMGGGIGGPGGFGGYNSPEATERGRLDTLYRAKAADITIKYTDPEKEGKSTFEVDWMTKTRIEQDETPNPEDIDFGSTLPVKVGEEWDYWFYKNEHPIEVIEHNMGSKGGLPNICFIVDSSGSMHWARDGGDSPYDLLCKSFYSVVDYLEKNDKAFHIDYSMVNFSSRSEFSGWHSYYNLDHVKQQLFNYQGGGTHLSAQKLREVQQSATDKFIAIMITDGQLYNEDEVAREVKNMIDAGNDFSLIQIGMSSNLGTRIKRYGAEVNTVRTAADLEELVLTKTKKSYDY